MTHRPFRPRTPPSGWPEQRHVVSAYTSQATDPPHLEQVIMGMPTHGAGIPGAPDPAGRGLEA